jgi:hypothetical protein
MFRDRQTNEQIFTMKSEVVCQPSAVRDGLVQSADQKICERQRFTISELLYEFQQISCTVLYKIITVRLGYHNFYARWAPKMLMSAQNAEKFLQL